MHTDPGTAVAVEALDALAAAHDAELGIWCGSGGVPLLARRADESFPAASTIKVALLIAVYRAAERGALDLDEQVPVHDTFASAVPGASYTATQAYDNDDEPWQRLGEEVSLRWLARRAVVRSSNLATNLLLERVGAAEVAAVHAAAGADGCALRRGIQDHPAGAAGLHNQVTAAGLASVMTALASGRLLSADGSREVEEVLAACEHTDGIPAGLPAGTRVATKPGWIDHHAHDVTLIRPEHGDPVVIAVLTRAALDEVAGFRLVAEVAAVCWDALGATRRGGRR